MTATSNDDGWQPVKIRSSLRRWFASKERSLTIVIGTRAQLIKMAPLMQEFEDRGIGFELIFTGQHHLTMHELLNEFQIATPPQHLFPRQEVSGMLSMLVWFPRVVIRLIRMRRCFFRTQQGAPRLTLVHGDTMSTLAGAIAGKIAGVPIAHVEAGLRSFRLTDPFPEEITRVLVSRFADIHFCPSCWACDNLRPRKAIQVNTAQNTLLDALRYAESAPTSIPGERPRNPYCVVSVHRFENIYSRRRMEWLADQIRRLCSRVNVEFVLHPATAKRLEIYGLKEKLAVLPSLRFRPRMTYVPFIQLLSGSSFVLTDGGSNQEELHYMGKPALLIRSSTERPEGLDQLVRLCNFQREILDEFVDSALTEQNEHNRLFLDCSPSAIIADFIRQSDALPK